MDHSHDFGSFWSCHRKCPLCSLWNSQNPGWWVTCQKRQFAFKSFSSLMTHWSSLRANSAAFFHGNCNNLRMWHEVFICSASSRAWKSCLSLIPLQQVQAIPHTSGGNIIITSSRTLQYCCTELLFSSHVCWFNQCKMGLRGGDQVLDGLPLCTFFWGWQWWELHWN